MGKSKKDWTVLSILEWATDYFEERNIPGPRTSIEWILSDVLQIKRLDLYLQYDRPLSRDELDKIRPLVQRRARHEPLQYITGSTDFMNCSIKVTPGVLIPRAETEQLVEILLDHYKEQKGFRLRLLDIGTGSGCIPVAIKKDYPEWHCAGLDISSQALTIAEENAKKNETEVHFYQCDLFQIHQHSGLSNQDWDIVISNPPYITEAEKEDLDVQVIGFEPSLALFHQQPLLLYRHIVEFAGFKGADLFLECNDKFAGQIEEIVASRYQSVKLLKDLDQNDRFVVGMNPFT